MITGECAKHSHKVVVDSGISCYLKRAFFEGWGEEGKEFLDLVLISAEASGCDSESERAVAVAADCSIFVFEDDSRVDRATSHNDSFFIDFVAQGVAELDELGFGRLVEDRPG